MASYLDRKGAAGAALLSVFSSRLRSTVFQVQRDSETEPEQLNSVKYWPMIVAESIYGLLMNILLIFYVKS